MKVTAVQSMIYLNKYIIRPSPSFENELQETYLYIKFKLKEPITAKRIYKTIKKEIYSLQYFPERHIKITDYKDKKRNLHRLLIYNYVIIYEVVNDTRASFYFTYIS